MIISRLVLKNWRNFRTFDVTFGDRVIIIGPNASGKSNLLDAVRFLRDIALPGGGLQTAISSRGGLIKVRCLAARREPEVEIEVELSDGESRPTFRYAIGINQEVRRRRQPLLKFERVWKNGIQILDRPDQNDKADELRLTQTHLEQISANAEFRAISRVFQSIRYLHLVPQVLKHPELFQGPAHPEDPFGRKFLELIATTPDSTRKSRLRKIEAALQKAIPQLGDLLDTKDDAGVPHLEMRYKHWRPNAGRQREDQFSDGTLRLIGLFWSLLDGDAPLLLEEPELSLHSELVKKLPALFSRVLRKNRRQLFISTHSWDLLSEKGIGGEEVVMLTPGKEGTVAKLASSVDEVRKLLEAGLSVADAALPLTRPEVDQLSLHF